MVSLPGTEAPERLPSTKGVELALAAFFGDSRARTPRSVTVWKHPAPGKPPRRAMTSP